MSVLKRLLNVLLLVVVTFSNRKILGFDDEFLKDVGFSPLVTDNGVGRYELYLEEASLTLFCEKVTDFQRVTVFRNGDDLNINFDCKFKLLEFLHSVNYLNVTHVSNLLHKIS